MAGSGAAGTASAQYLDAWATSVAQGQNDLRDADISLLNSALVEVGVIHFTKLMPLSALEPFPIGIRRSITLNQERFEFLP